MSGFFGDVSDGKPTRGSPAKKPQIDRELFEALCVACDLDWKWFTKSERGKVNAACKELKEVGATPAQVKQRAEQYKREFRGAALTPTAISGQWAYLGAKMEASQPKGTSRQERVARCLADGHQRADDASRCCSRCGVVVPEWCVEVCERWGHHWLANGRCETYEYCGGVRTTKATGEWSSREN